MDVSASKLRYRLIEGAIRLEPLRILTSRESLWGDWTVTCFVLGASHAVRLESSGVAVTELLACADLDETSTVLLDIPGNEPLTACRTVDGLVCRAEIMPFSLASGDGLEGSFSLGQQLQFAYPNVPGGVTPYTRVGWKAVGDELVIETIHTYPEEGIGIRSRSRFLSHGVKEQVR